MQKVAITTLGCKINQFESAAMAESLGREGFQVVPFGEPADFYVINTCTVTSRTDAESRRLIRRAVRNNPAARIVVTGCYAQVATAELQAMTEVDLILGNLEKKEIAGLLREIGAEKKVLVADISKQEKADALVLESFAEHTRAFLQVQNGCNAFCSYCIVPYARGRSRSVPPEEVLTAVKTFSDKGFKEVVLTGIHLSGYGLDLEPQTTLASLLADIEEHQLTGRLRLGSLEPTEIPAEMVEYLKTSKIICNHLHIPLQSGSDSVLQRMKRPYTAEFVRNLLSRLTDAVPDLCIGLDVIAGFPGETDQEFAATHDLIEKLPVAYLHVFPFSSRPGTPAADMSGRVASHIIKERAELLRKLAERKKQEYYQRFVGKDVLTLIQGKGKSGILTGLSRNYLPVRIYGEETLLNTEVSVRVIEVGEDYVNGILCD